MCKICQATSLIAIVMKRRLGKDEHEISRVMYAHRFKLYVSRGGGVNLSFNMTGI